jgi:hypothetical protein
MPVQPSPMFTFAGFASGEDAFVDEDIPVVATLDSLDGVKTVAWNIESVDDQALIGDYIINVSGPFDSVATIQSQGQGSSVALRCVVNNGEDPRTETVSPTMQRTQIFYVPTAAGLRVRVLGEDQFSTDRNVIGFNNVVRTVDAIAGGEALNKLAKMRPGFRLVAVEDEFTPSIASDAPDSMYVAQPGANQMVIPDADTFLEEGDDISETIGRSFSIANFCGGSIECSIAASNTVYSGSVSATSPDTLIIPNVPGMVVTFVAVGSNTWVATPGLEASP